MKQTGYKMKEYGIPTKRYCQTLDLKADLVRF
jgi:L-rhamnose mutarotase